MFTEDYKRTKEKDRRREGKKERDGGDGDRRWKDERILERTHPMGHEEH